MSFDPAKPIDSVFAELIGQPCWNVRRGHGSFLTFEFGQPHLSMDDPPRRLAKPDQPAWSLVRRSPRIRGDWHLWIHCCHWRAVFDGNEVCHSESPDGVIEQAAFMLDGQKLIGVDVANGATRFRFDLGGALETTPYDGDPTDEVWMLFTPGGYVLTYRADSCYSWHAGSASPDGAAWIPVA